MHNLINTFRNFLNQGQARTILAKKNVVVLFFIKVFNIFVSYMMVTLSISYLGMESYGIWIVLSGFVMWANIFDLGLTHGLRNRLAELKSKNLEKSAKYLVSTAYAFLVVVSLIIFMLFFNLITLVNWSQLLNTNLVNRYDLEVLILIIVSLFLIQFILKPLNAVLESLQLPAAVHAINFSASVITLIFIYFSVGSKAQQPLFIYACIYFGSTIFIMLLVSIVLYLTKLKVYKPSIEYIEKKSLKKIAGLGILFFIMQICVIIISQTDNIIIAYLLGPEKVVEYNIVYKYFSVLIVMFNILVTPLWTGVTDAYSSNDIEWIKRTINKLLKIVAVSFLISIFMIIISDFVYKFWIADDIEIPLILSFLMALYMVLFNLTAIFAFFINGVGKLRLAVSVNIVAALFNIPLSFYFARELEMGISGVLLGTIVTISFTGIFVYIQYRKIITNSAYGIWNK